MADDRPTNDPRPASGADEPTPPGAGTPDPQAPDASAVPGGRFTDDEARPIFREAAEDADAATVRTPAEPGASAGRGATGAAGTSDGADGDETAEGPARAGKLSFTPRARPTEDDATALLPRTTGRTQSRALVDPASDGDLNDLDDAPRRIGRRGRLALLIGAVAAVVVVGLAIGYAVVGATGQPGASGDPSGDASAPTSSDAGTPSAVALLDDASMLTPQGVAPVGPKLTFTAGEIVRGPIPDGSGAACLGGDPLEGAPTAQQTITRTLTATGSNPPTATHIAQAYASVEDATQAYAVTARALGTCAVPGDWVAAGRSVEGVGDESTAVAVQTVAGGARTQHWVVLSRTGRALDVVDASTQGKAALNVNTVTQALASTVAVQCGPAGGTCPTTITTKDAPPPAGGDEPGFLTTGDLPPVGATTAPWVGTPVEAPSADFSGSQCESVNWSTTAATSKASRVYLLQDVPGIFGLNQIALTSRDATAASKLVDKVRTDWTSCKERKLTATVDKPTKVSGVAADGTAVTGWTTEVEQKAGSTVTRFRVGIASSGDKVAFVFLNPQKGLDVTAADWNTVAVRAVQRATQN